MLSILGICASSEDRENRQRSIQIDKEIEQESQRQRQICKLLLLGSGESGKSTIVKQIKIIHQGGYTLDELKAWRSIVYRNLIDSAKDVISSAEKLEVSFENPRNNEEFMHVIKDFTLAADIGTQIIPEFIVVAIESIWQDERTAEVMEKGSSQFYIMDSAAYFLSQVRRLAESDYIPTVDDVIRARLKTTGILETFFQLGKLNIHMFDVGGQRSERKKWIHCFESVDAIVFCVALSEYDQVLLEETKQNRMVESLVLFESVVNSRWFLRTQIILLLNKTDLFVEKLARVPLQRYFPEYAGGSDPGKAAKYILYRFNQTNRMKLHIYPHLTQATSTSNIKFVFEGIKKTLIDYSLKTSNLM